MVTTMAPRQAPAYQMLRSRCEPRDGGENRARSEDHDCRYSFD